MGRLAANTCGAVPDRSRLGRHKTYYLLRPPETGGGDRPLGLRPDACWGGLETRTTTPMSRRRNSSDLSPGNPTVSHPYAMMPNGNRPPGIGRVCRLRSPIRGRHVWHVLQKSIFRTDDQGVSSGHANLADITLLKTICYGKSNSSGGVWSGWLPGI